MKCITICETWQPGARLIVSIFLYWKLQKSFLQKTRALFGINLAEMLIRLPSITIVKFIAIRKEHGRQERGLFSLYVVVGNLKNIFFSKKLLV